MSETLTPAVLDELEALPTDAEIDEALSSIRGWASAYWQEFVVDEDESASHDAELAKVKGVIDRLIASARRQQPEGWRDISTAPKDGTEFLAWPCLTTDGEIVVKAHRYKHPSVEGWITDEIDCNDYDFRPTHWQPLPAAPASEPKP